MSLFGGLASGVLSSALGGLFGGGGSVQDAAQNMDFTRTSESDADAYSTGFTRSSSGPGEFTGGLFQDVFLPSALSAFQSSPTGSYTGPLSAAPDALQIQANQGAEQTAFNAIGQGQGVRTLADQLLSGQTLDPRTNPGFSGVVSAATRPAIESFSQDVVPQLTSQAIASGAYGGSRNGIALGLAADRLGQSLQDTTSNLAYSNFQAERQRQLQAPSLLGAAYSLDQQPFQTASALGAERQGFAQDAINENYQLDQLARTQPFQSVGQFGSLLQQVGDQLGTGINEGSQNSAQTSFDRSVGVQSQDPGTFGTLTNALNLGAGYDYLQNSGNPGIFSGIQSAIPGLIQYGNTL